MTRQPYDGRQEVQQMTYEEWRRLFRSEIRRNARRRLLEECPVPADTPEMQFRRQILDSRYQTQGGAEIDTFIRGWVTAGMLDPGKKEFRMNARAQRDIDRLLSDWHLEQAEQLGDKGLAILEDEFYNMILLYIAISKDDRKYSRTLFDLRALDQKTVIKKLAAEISHITCELPEKLGLADRLAVLRTAAEQAFFDACDQPLHGE